MGVDESTLEFYMKQGFYTPNTPHDLRVQLQTTHDMLELLTCDGTIAGNKGLTSVLEPSRWAQMATVLSDRFKSEKVFGAKFCYSLDRHLQTFFKKVTRWENLATEGQARYLVNKAEELMERLEDGQGLNIVLPVALSFAATTVPDKKSAREQLHPTTRQRRRRLRRLESTLGRKRGRAMQTHPIRTHNPSNPGRFPPEWIVLTSSEGA
jgi:hypothetical protein